MRQLAVIFDGDDTLWFVEALYDAARDAAAQIVKTLGLDGARWQALQKSIDVANVARLGLSRTRFPSSSVEAYRVLSAEAGRGFDQTVADRIWSASDAVFETEAPLATGAHEVLNELREHFALGLVTKGDQSVQRHRLARSGLGAYFDTVEIVAEKDEECFRAQARALDVPPEACWSVGNSLPSDINPALRIGMSAVWIDAHVWDHERREVDAHDGMLVVEPDLLSAGRLLMKIALEE